MKKITVLLFICSAAAISVSAQKKLSFKPKYVEWEEKPVVHNVPREYANEPAIILQQEVSRDYRYEGHHINVYYTVHRVVKVLDDKGIEMYNKVAIPVNPDTRVPSIKARTILPNGKVRDIAKDMIKVTRNENGQNEIVFAMEGVEKNAEIEVLLKEIRPLSFFGSEEFQFEVPVLSARFDMSYPRELVFEEKGYNGFPTVRDTLLNNRRHITAVASDIPALHSEPHSFYNVYRMRAEYRIHNFIDENENDNSKVYTWDDLARKMYEEHYKITDKERAVVNKYLTTLGVHANGDEAENIRKIEDGIKSNIVLYADMDEDNADVLDSVVANRAATPSGCVKLFAACFTQAGVNYELGMAGDRREHKFDNKFENWGNMEYYVFYFPGLKNFLSPTSVYYRYPMVPDAILTAKGIFCTIPPKGDLIGGVSEVKTITPPAATDNQDNIAAGVSFTDDMNAMVDVSYSYTGYNATDLRKEIATQTKEKEKDLVKKIVTFAEKPEHIVKYTISNEAIENAYKNTPLEITATMSTSGLVEKAGKQYLFKIGEILGPQDELYNDKERILPVDLAYPHSLNRTITINIPKGYKVMNPEAIKMKSDFVDKKMRPVIGFSSDYTLKTDKKNGDKLVVTITEFYSQIHFPTADYERYREVVNSAADFNKVSLVLAKKG